MKRSYSLEGYNYCSIKQLLSIKHGKKLRFFKLGEEREETDLEDNRAFKAFWNLATLPALKIF